LHLEEAADMVLVSGTNLESKKYGKKGIVKVSNKFFKKHEINKNRACSTKCNAHRDKKISR